MEHHSPVSSSEILSDTSSVQSISLLLRACTLASSSTPEPRVRHTDLILIIASLSVGNILPINAMPEGTIICNLETKAGDRGSMARTSGTSAIIIGHSDDGAKTRVKLPSGIRRTVPGVCRAMIGVCAGGGRTDKPMLKAGNSWHKAKAKRKNWPIVRGVAMNPVEHPHGGGNHQHVGHPTTVGRMTPHGRKVGLIAARRTGPLRGGQSGKLMKQDR